MSAGKSPTTDIRVPLQLNRRETLDWKDKFHVSQLAHVEIMTASTSKPSEENVAGGLDQSFSNHHALSLILEWALTRVRLQNRLPRFLDLQQKRILIVAEEKPDVAPRGDAANSDDSQCEIFEPVAVEYEAAVVRQRCAVVFNPFSNEIRTRFVASCA